MNDPLESSPTISSLPEEIFRNIFSHLAYDDIMNCSKVCVHWNNLIEELGECFWMKKCALEYPDIYEDSHRTSGLSWHHLYRSLHSWKDINDLQDSSNVDHIIIRHEQYGIVCLLENNIISYPIRHMRLLSDRRRQNQKYKTNFYAVVYFDAKKREIMNIREFGVNFKNYRESDDIIVIEIVEGNQHILRVISKRCDNEVTEQVIFDFMEECSWFVVNNDVYYQTKEGNVIKLHRLRVIQENGKARFENSALARSNKCEILALVPFGNTVHLLKRRSTYWIYVVEVKDNALKRLVSFYTYNMTSNVMFKEFSKYGFYLRNPDFNCEVLNFDGDKLLSEKPGDHETVIPYGPYTMTFTCPAPWIVKINVAANEVSAPHQCFQIEIDPFSLPLITTIDLIQILECDSGHIILFGYNGCTVMDNDIFKRLILIFINRK